MKPMISVLMPVYNSEKYLREAIDSIIFQTYTDWELIIINDGATDNSKAIIESYSDSRIRYFENPQNIGLIKTLNKGIDLCRGEYVARMDSDDISMADRFSLQVDFLEKNKDCAMCGTDAFIINGGGETTGEIMNFRTNEYLQINLLFSVPFVHPSVMIRTSVLKDLMFDLNYIHAEDYDLWCRVADNHKVANIPSFLLKYRWHNTNVSVLNEKTQDGVKNEIIRRQIGNLGLDPTDRDLYFHRITFKQYDVKNNEARETFVDYDGLSKWFQKLIEANQICGKYDPDALMAYLWARWIVLCVAQKTYLKALNPTFASFKQNVFIRIFDLLLFFKKK